MAGESSGLWNNLPSIIIVEIFSFLSLKDRLRASSVCKTWRNNLFHPKLWRKVVFHLNSCDNMTVNQNNDGARFLANNLCSFVREVIVEVNSSNPRDIKLCEDILKGLTFNNNLRALSIRPRSSRLEGTGCKDAITVHLYAEFLMKIVKRAHCLEHLSLGCIQGLLNLSPHFLKPLAKYQASCIRSLHISSVQELPGSYFIYGINCSMFQTFLNLESLSINYDYMSDQLLDALSQPHRRPLCRLNVHVHSYDDNMPVISTSAWKQITTHSSNLEVTLSLLHFRSFTDEIEGLFNEAMPLTHFRVLFSSAFSLEVLVHIAFINGNTLKSLVLVNRINEDATTYSSFVRHSIDPIIMVAWRCKYLSRIKIIGYEVCADSLIAVSRLREESLKHLQVPSCCISTKLLEDSLKLSRGDALNHMQYEVSCGLQMSWHPMALHELPHAVRNANVDPDGAYLDELLQDQIW